MRTEASNTLKLTIGVAVVAVLALTLQLSAQDNPHSTISSSAQEKTTNKVASDAINGSAKLTKHVRLLAPSQGGPPPYAYSQCLEIFSIPCYTPQLIRNSYEVTALLNAGYTGAGQTIIIVDSFGSPTIAQDLKTFDAGLGLPDPPSFTVLAPLGSVPFDPNDPDQVNWAAETTLDVESAHAIAPGASIVLLTSPVDETNGVQGLPEFLFLEKYALDHHLGNIISQSWAATENTLFDPIGRQVVSDFEEFYERAAREKVTVLAASGDSGSTGPNTSGGYYDFPVAGFPASSPWVTAVGGTSLYADQYGNYQYEPAWNNGGVTLASGLQGDATGGGVSQIFSEPDYQSGLPGPVQQILNGYRGFPDVAYNADGLTPIWIYVGFFPDAPQNGWYTAMGTSEGSPQWAGIVAIANQYAGRPLGFLNPKLYALGARGDGSKYFHDITFGSNAFPFAGVPGYLATPGWDLTTGWGTPKADKLVKALAQQGD